MAGALMNGRRSMSKCGRRWADPFGETNECAKAEGHDGPCTTAWALDSGSRKRPIEPQDNGSSATPEATL